MRRHSLPATTLRLSMAGLSGSNLYFCPGLCMIGLLGSNLYHDLFVLKIITLAVI